MGDPKNNENEKSQTNSKSNRLVVHLKDKTIISNRLYIQKKNLKNLNDTVNSVSQMNNSAHK